MVLRIIKVTIQWECLMHRALINKSLMPNITIQQHETFTFMVSPPAMSLEGEKVGGWWKTSMAVSRLSCRQILVGTWLAIPLLLCRNVL